MPRSIFLPTAFMVGLAITVVALFVVYVVVAAVVIVKMRRGENALSLVTKTIESYQDKFVDTGENLGFGLTNDGLVETMYVFENFDNRLGRVSVGIKDVKYGCPALERSYELRVIGDADTRVVNDAA